MRNTDEFKKLVTEKYNKQKYEYAQKRKKLTVFISSTLVFAIIASVLIGTGSIERFFDTNSTVLLEDNIESDIPDSLSNTANDDQMEAPNEDRDESPNSSTDSHISEPMFETSEPNEEYSGAKDPDDNVSDIPNDNPDPQKPIITETVNLMAEIKPKYINTSTNKFSDNETINGVTDFAFDLFRNSYAEGENNLLSPSSAIYALAMLANGTDGYTLNQLEEKLCGTDLDRLNEFMLEYRTLFGEGEYYNTSISNSIWFDSEVSISDQFLQTNADYYGSDAYQTILPSDAALDDLNNWAKEKTNGLIDKILDKFDENPKIILANALYFEANWVDEMSEIGEKDFITSNGTTVKAEMMRGNADYLENSFCYGFEKDYFGRYSFVALLPKDDMTVSDILNNLDTESYNALWDNYFGANITMPKFEIDDEIDLVSALKKCGIDDIFAGGTNNLSKIGTIYGGDFYVSDVKQKTTISVDEKGTLAAAVTTIIAEPDGALPTETKTVNLDRPFVYMIIDRQTHIPMFIGTVETL